MKRIFKQNRNGVSK